MQQQLKQFQRNVLERNRELEQKLSNEQLKGKEADNGLVATMEATNSTLNKVT